MTRFILPITLSALCVSTLAVAHTGVQNPAVLARMESMKVTQDSTKVLGAMVKGDVTFDAVIARAAAETIAKEAARTKSLFEGQETDPKSEALPTIWKDFDDFNAKSRDLYAVATALSVSLETEEELRIGLGQIGGACKACHEAYRE